MKKIAACVLIGVLFTSAVVSYSEELSMDISEDVIRLHVIADSNEDRAQEVKLKVRDKVLAEIKKVENKEDIESLLPLLEKSANNLLEMEGCSYRAKAEFGEFDFPTKYYDGFALPKGRYKAVRVKLGKAEGENWWCVLFPPLCMVDAATCDMDALLKDTFGENYSVVAEGEKPKFKLKFKLAELF